MRFPVIVAVLALCGHGEVLAADVVTDDTNAPIVAPGGTRSPGDLSNEERLEMMKQANGYNTCVYERALASLDADPDIRRIADIAMGECDEKLDELGATISGWGMPDYFAEGFTRSVRDRAARKLLPELAIRKSR